MTQEIKAPVPPFSAETAAQIVRMAEDAWNSRDPDRVVLVYTENITITIERGIRMPSATEDVITTEPTDIG